MSCRKSLEAEMVRRFKSLEPYDNEKQSIWQKTPVNDGQQTRNPENAEPSEDDCAVYSGSESEDDD